MLGTKKTPSECPPGTKRTSKGKCKKVKAITLPSGDMVGVLEGQRKQYVAIPSDMPGIDSTGQSSDDSNLETSLVSAIQASLKKISNQLNRVNNLDEKVDKLLEKDDSNNNGNSEVIVPKRRGGGRSRRRTRKSRMKKSKKTLRHHRS
jgi:hypothetical protein